MAATSLITILALSLLGHFGAPVSSICLVSGTLLGVLDATFEPSLPV